MSEIILLFGGNLEEPKEYIDKAVWIIEQEIGELVKRSSYFESEPWGFEHGSNFINQIAIYKTLLVPHKILNLILNVEAQLGRVRNKKGYSARTIDIDILFYDDLIVNEPDLIIPHPRIQDRKFVLEPLKEMQPDLVHPILKISVNEMYEKCTDKNWVKKVTNN